MIPEWGAKIPHALGPKSQNIIWKQKYNKFDKGFKNGPCQKKKKSLKKMIPSCPLTLKVKVSEHWRDEGRAMLMTRVTPVGAQSAFSFNCVIVTIFFFSWRATLSPPPLRLGAKADDSIF